MTVADLKKDKPDSLGDTVLVIYGYKPPEYAVYGARSRVSVQFADDPDSEAKQRKAMASLNPIRGEINGLIDGWRLSERETLKSKASRYDRRVADALIVALERDTDSAATILATIKQDIVDERTAWARFEYLLAAFVLSLVCIALAEKFASDLTAGDLWRAAAAGSTGAFFSISLAIRTRTVLPDFQRTSNLMDASLRIVIGFISASVLMALVSAQAVTVGLGDAKLGFPADKPWLFVLIVGFIAGFTERFVPDLLATATASAQGPPTPAQKPIPPAGAGSPASAAVAAGQAAEAADVKDNEAKTPDPAPAEEDVDHCLCGLDTSQVAPTLDKDLPPASGGVAATTGGERAS